MPKDDGATAFEVGKRLKLDKSAALAAAARGDGQGLRRQPRTRKGQPGKYRLTDQEIEAEKLLPSVEEIRRWSPPSATPPKSAQPRNRTGFDNEDQ